MQQIEIKVTTMVEDGPETSYQRVKEAVPATETTPEIEGKWDYVQTGRMRMKEVEIYKQRVDNINLQEIILAVNQPHIINRTGKCE